MSDSDAIGAFGEFVTAADPVMTIVTAWDGRERAGCLVGFGTQCSIDPPRFLVCISKENRTHAVALRTQHLVVHALPDAPDVRALAALFGSETGDRIDKFAGVKWLDGPGGAPVIDACRPWFAGPIIARYDLGDHTGHLLDVTDACAAEPDARRLLVYSDLADLEAGHPA